MNRYHIIRLTFVAAATVALPSFAVEVRTYQFSSDNRPYRYQAWAPATDAQLIGTFDLVLDPSAGTAQLTNIQATIVNPAYAPPNQGTPLTASQRAYFDNVPLSTRWPTNLASLTGHFLAPDLLEFDGPNNNIYFRQDTASSLPYIGFSLPGYYNADAYDTALQLRLGSDSATLTGVATQIFWNDATLHYLLGARATLVPEPSTLALAVIAAATISTRRRKLTSRHRV
jgi:hypothetical protein